METADYLQDILHAKVTLKIITKTKNERFFIEKWIKHHLAIIGDGKLIIFDNMSDDEHVLQVYEKYKDNILLVKFDFYFDKIHDYEVMKDFYDAIGESSDFFIVLDSDEFLYLYDDSTAVHDSRITDYLKKNTDCDFFAPCWLENIEGEEKILNLNSPINGIREKSEFIELFDWGKAIINSRIFKNPKFKKYDNVPFRHTVELPLLDYTKAKTHFFIAHLTNLDRQQRFLTNMQKLVSCKMLDSVTDYEGLINLSKSRMGNTSIRSYIKQTRKLMEEIQGNLPLTPSVTSSDKLIEIGKDDKLYFPNKFIEQAFRSLTNANYLRLINYNYSKENDEEYRLLVHWMSKYPYEEW